MYSAGSNTPRRGDIEARDDLLSLYRCAEVIVINDTPLHLGDNANQPTFIGTSFTGSGYVDSDTNFTAATLEIEFLGESNPFGVSGIDLYPDPPTVVVNGNQITITEEDVPGDSGCMEYDDLTDQFADTCIFTGYSCPFTYKIDITNIVIPSSDNTVRINAGIPDPSHCGTTPNYDDFAIGDIRIVLH